MDSGLSSRLDAMERFDSELLESSEHAIRFLSDTQTTPTDYQLKILWLTWSALFAVFAICSCTISLAILLSKKARGSPFNWYLIYLIIPDCLNVATSSVVSAVFASGAYTQWICNFQSFSIAWMIASKAWLNAVVGYELHYMLWSSLRCIRYQPPTIKRATRNAAAVYVWSIVLACWSAYGPWWLYPVNPNLRHHLLCIPIEFTVRGQLVFWLAYLPCLVLIPHAYLLWMVYDTWCNELLPRKGQRRMLSIYFLRLVVACVIMSFPALIIYTALPNDNAWVGWAGGVCGNGQVFISAILSLWKRDIWTALRQFLTCQPCNSPNANVASAEPELQLSNASVMKPRKQSMNTLRSSSQSSQLRAYSANRFNPSSSIGSLQQLSPRSSLRSMGPLGAHLQARRSSMPVSTIDTQQQTQGPVTRFDRQVRRSSLPVCSLEPQQQSPGAGLNSYRQARRCSWAPSLESQQFPPGTVPIFELPPSAVFERPGDCLEISSDGESEEDGNEAGEPQPVADPQDNDSYEDVPKQSSLHFQFDDELDENNPQDTIAFHITEENDESDLPVCPFDF